MTKFEASGPLPSLDLDEFLIHALKDPDAIPLPEVTGHPYDTAIDLGNTERTPYGIENNAIVKDVRELGDRTSPDLGRGDILRGTFNFYVPGADKAVIALFETNRPLPAFHKEGGYYSQYLAGMPLFYDPERYTQFRDEASRLGILRLIGDITVGGVPQHPHLHILSSIYALERPYTGDRTALQEGNSTVLSGTVAEYHEDLSPGYDEAETPRVVLDAAHGRETIFLSPLSRLPFRGGSHRTLYQEASPNHPVAGDTIQVRAYVNREVGFRIGVHSTTVSADLRNRKLSIVHLSEPGLDRWEESFRTSGDFEAAMDKLKNAPDNAAFRAAFAEFLWSRMDAKSDVQPFVLTRQEDRVLRQIFQEYADPDQWPYGANIKPKDALHVKEEYGVDLLAMTPGELADLAREVGRGHRTADNDYRGIGGTLLPVVRKHAGPVYHEVVQLTLTEGVPAVLARAHDAGSLSRSDFGLVEDALQAAIDRNQAHMPQEFMRAAEQIFDVQPEAVPNIRILQQSLLAQIHEMIATCGTILRPRHLTREEKERPADFRTINDPELLATLSSWVPGILERATSLATSDEERAYRESLDLFNKYQYPEPEEQVRRIGRIHHILQVLQEKQAAQATGDTGQN